jgi:methylmalonyl-CoA mutase N-terminal domain/subunit
MELHRPDPEAERRQRERLERTRAARDESRAAATLETLKGVAAGDANLMPAILECARARVSEGEMVAAMQEVFGTYTEHPQF